MFPLLLMCLLSVSYLLSAPAESQVPTEHPDVIAGPWEMASASGIDGIAFQIVTLSSGPEGEEHFDSQAISIRVYHRKDGKERWGYFATQEKANPQLSNLVDDHSLTLFDGERLRIHFVDTTDIQPFDLDVTFSPAAQEWSGTWSHSRQSSRVVLKRPQASPGVTPNAFVGDWAGESHLAPGILHIWQSTDGMLSAWLDRTLSGYDPRTQLMHHDQRSGERLEVDVMTDNELILETTNPGGLRSEFRGSLSEDHQMLSGNWARPDGGRLSAPDQYRRVVENRN